MLSIIFDYMFDLKNSTSTPLQKTLEMFSNKKLGVNEYNFDALFMRVCQLLNNFPLGKAYLKHIEESGKKPNVATLSQFLHLCFICKDEVDSPEDVLKICRFLLGEKFIDAMTLQNVILGLTVTGNWREGLNLLPKIEESSSSNSLSLNALAACALKENDTQVSLNLMKKIFNEKKVVKESLYDIWIEKSLENVTVQHLFMTFLSQNEIFPNTSLIDKIKGMFENNLKNKFSGSYSTVSPQGRCSNCGVNLTPNKLTDGQYVTLKDALLERVLCGTDVFVESNPKEVENFHLFVHSTAPYDIVIDGLNVAYTLCPRHGNKGRAFKLLSVVEYFSRRGNKVLVIGRQHMQSWDQLVLKKIQRNARLYMLDNLSSDDLFILYATLYSGRGARFVSSDIMRDHLFQLHDIELEKIFRNWRRSSQLMVLPSESSTSFKVSSPPPYTTITQCSSDGNHWHVPYDDGKPRFNWQLPDTWLCLKRIVN
nr:EOG090X0CGF [Sida crystallina]